MSIIVDSNDENDLGEYIVEILGSIDEGPQQGTASSFRFTVVISPDLATSVNTPPIFLEDLPPIIELTAGKDEFTFNLEIPPTFDAEDDNVILDFDFGALNGFLKHDKENNQVIPDRQGGQNFDLVPTGTTGVSITLTDDNPTGPLSSFYSVFIRVKAKPVNPPVCQNPPCEPQCDNPPCPPKCENPPCEPVCENPPCDKPPVISLPADPGLISDITNTGDIVVNLDNGFNLNDLLESFERRDRRRAL